MNMEMTLTPGPGGRFLRCAVSGQANVEGAQRLLEDIRATAPGTTPARLLIDLLAVTGELPLSGQFSVGMGSSQAFKRFNRVAVVQAKRVNNGFGALVAKNRGLNIEVFDTEAEALKWLLR